MNESQVSKVAVFENSINLTYASGKIHFIRFTDKEEGDEGYLFGGGSLHSSSALRDLLFKERDEVLFRGSSYQQREESSAIPLEERAIDIQDFTKSDQFRQAPSQEKLLQNRNILVWSPFTIYADMLYLDLSLRLLGEDHLGFNVKLIRDKKATMDSLKEITNYGMIFLFTHGDPDGKCIVTGEEITKDNEVHMLDDGVYYSSEKKISSTYPYIEEKPTYFAVSYDWISANVPKNENNKIVIVDACHCGTVDWWNAFSTIGAGDYFGWDGRVNTPCIINRSGNLILELKYGVSTTEDVYKPYICNFGRGIWKRFGYPVRFAVSDNPPVISDLSADPPSVDINQPTTITCIASDLDGDSLTYDWTVNAGSFEGSTSGPSVTWRAPSTADIYIVVGCEVSDGKGGEDTDTLNIVVTEPDTTLPAPTGVDASWGTYTDKVYITWNSVTGASYYQVYRSDYQNSTKTAITNWQSNRYHYDYEVTPGTTYFYFVKAASSNSGADESPFSAPDEGYAYVPPPTSDEDKIEDVIHKYCQASSDQDWDEARSCCVYGSTAYEQISYTEEIWPPIEGLTDYNLNASIIEIIINGDYAEVNLNMNVEATISGEVYQDSVEGWLYLQKIDSGWKLYDSLFDEDPFDDYESPDGDTYALRDTGPAGGYIFYDKGYYSSGWRYLEAAPASTEWPGNEWGSYGTLIGGTGTGIGTGQSNTTIIVTWLNSHFETDRAAQLCDALIYGGYSDWFLPSKDELNLMYENLIIFGVGGFAASGDYWSSSEYLAYFSLCQRFSSYDTFSDGMQLAAHKNDTNWVRAVRAF